MIISRCLEFNPYPMASTALPESNGVVSRCLEFNPYPMTSTALPENKGVVSSCLVFNPYPLASTALHVVSRCLVFNPYPLASTALPESKEKACHVGSSRGVSDTRCRLHVSMRAEPRHLHLSPFINPLLLERVCLSGAATLWQRSG